MKAVSSRRMTAAMLSAAALIFFLLPREARADGIDLPILLGLGVVVLIPLMLFQVVVEGAILWRLLRAPFHSALLVALYANMASLAAGVPVKIAAATLDSAMRPKDLIAYYRFEPKAIVCGILAYFAATLIVEYLVVAAWGRRRAIPSRKTAAKAVLVANLATYAVMAPIYFHITRPEQGLRELADSTQWASKPAERIFFTDVATRHLCSVLTDGSHKEEIVPDAVRDYQFFPGQRLVLYRNDAGNLCLWKPVTRKCVVVWATDERFNMEQVGCSPDGKWVGYLARDGSEGAQRLIMFNTETGRRNSTEAVVPPQEDFETPEIAWSTSANVVLLKDNDRVTRWVIQEDGTAVPGVSAGNPESLAPVYGRFSRAKWGARDDWGTSFSRDKVGSTDIASEPGILSQVRIEAPGGPYVVSARAGILRLAQGMFGDVCLIAEGREAVVEKYPCLYLLDVEKRRLGKITDGEKFTLPTERYLRSIAWNATK